jgi:hypothetical protein
VRRQRLPTVTTMHGSIHAHDLAALLHEYGDVPLVSISNDQRRPVPDANWRHGLPRAAPYLAYRALLRRVPGPCHLRRRGSSHRDCPPLWRAAQDRGEGLSRNNRSATVRRPLLDASDRSSTTWARWATAKVLLPGRAPCSHDGLSPSGLS